MARTPAPLIGKRFGRLLVIANDIYHHARVICSCDCGLVVAAFRKNLVAGVTQSCGCLAHRKPKVTYTQAPGGHWYPSGNQQ